MELKEDGRARLTLDVKVIGLSRLSRYAHVEYVDIDGDTTEARYIPVDALEAIAPELEVGDVIDGSEVEGADFRPGTVLRGVNSRVTHLRIVGGDWVTTDPTYDGGHATPRYGPYKIIDFGEAPDLTYAF